MSESLREASSEERDHSTPGITKENMFLTNIGSDRALASFDLLKKIEEGELTIKFQNVETTVGICSSGHVEPGNQCGKCAMVLCRASALGRTNEKSLGAFSHFHSFSELNTVGLPSKPAGKLDIFI